MEPATKLTAQRRLSNLERPDQAHAISSATRRRGTGRAIKICDGAGALHRATQKANCPAGLAGRSFRVEHAARRTSHAEKNGRGRSRPDRRNRPAEAGTRRKAGSAPERVKKSLADVGWNDPA